MSIASRIQAIEQHLTDDYSVLTLAGADLTSVNKNILNLKPTWKERLLYFMNNGTQVVWNNWNKVTGTGTTLTLNNTEEAPMSLVYKGNTSQTGTPTPTTPIPVQVVSGDNSIVVSNEDNTQSTSYPISLGVENLLQFTPVIHNANGITIIYDDDTLTINGTATSNILSALNTITGNGQTYYLQTEVLSGSTTSTTSYVQVYYPGTVVLSQKISESGIVTGTLASGTYSTRLNIPSGAVFNNLKLRIHLQEGSTPKYISTTPIELCKIGTYQDKIDKSSGKNLVEGKITGYYLGNDGKFYASAYYDMHIAKVVEGQTYTATINESQLVCGFYASYPIAGSTTYNNSRLVQDSKTFTAPITGYIAFRTLSGYSFAMLNEGSTALPYEPYGTSWYLKKEIGKVVLNGSESWLKGDSNGRYNLNVSDAFLGSSSNNPILCTHLQQRFAITNYSIFLSSASHQFGVIYQDISWEVADFQSWLSTHNTTVYYALSTPTYETITDTTLIGQLEALKKSYEGQTNISQVNNDLPFELNVTALEEMN